MPSDVIDDCASELIIVVAVVGVIGGYDGGGHLDQAAALVFTASAAIVARLDVDDVLSRISQGRAVVSTWRRGRLILRLLVCEA